MREQARVTQVFVSHCFGANG